MPLRPQSSETSSPRASIRSWTERDLVLVQLQVLDRLAELGEVDAALILAPLDESVDSFCQCFGHGPFVYPLLAPPETARLRLLRIWAPLLQWIKEESHEEPIQDEL